MHPNDFPAENWCAPESNRYDLPRGVAQIKRGLPLQPDDRGVSPIASGRNATDDYRPEAGLTMQRKVMISCAVTGSADTPGKNPAVPVTPEQIAQSALDAAKAGAAIVHIHVRDPKTTRPSMDPAL